MKLKAVCHYRVRPTTHNGRKPGTRREFGHTRERDHTIEVPDDAIDVRFDYESGHAYGQVTYLVPVEEDE